MNCKQCKLEEATEGEFCFLCVLKAINVKGADKVHPKILANFLLNVFVPFMKKRKVELEDSKLSPKRLGNAVWLISLGRITQHQLKRSLSDFYDSDLEAVDFFEVKKDFSTITS